LAVAFALAKKLFLTKEKEIGKVGSISGIFRYLLYVAIIDAFLLRLNVVGDFAAPLSFSGAVASKKNQNKESLYILFKRK
jgi:hypothetical protein